MGKFDSGGIFGSGDSGDAATWRKIVEARGRERSGGGDVGVAEKIDPVPETSEASNEIPSVGEEPDLMSKEGPLEPTQLDPKVEALADRVNVLAQETAVKDAAELKRIKAEGAAMAVAYKANGAADQADAKQGDTGATVHPTAVSGTKETGQEAEPSPETQPAREETQPLEPPEGSAPGGLEQGA